MKCAHIAQKILQLKLAVFNLFTSQKNGLFLDKNYAFSGLSRPFGHC